MVGCFFRNRTICQLLIAVPLKMYSKFGQPKWILVSQMLKLAEKWPIAISSSAVGSFTSILHIFKFNHRLKNLFGTWYIIKIVINSKFLKILMWVVITNCKSTLPAWPEQMDTFILLSSIRSENKVYRFHANTQKTTLPMQLQVQLQQHGTHHANVLAAKQHSQRWQENIHCNLHAVTDWILGLKALVYHNSLVYSYPYNQL